MATAAMATGARLFDPLIVQGETMTVFACLSFQDLLIPLGFALVFGTLIVFAIIKLFRSGGSK